MDNSHGSILSIPYTLDQYLHMYPYEAILKYIPYPGNRTWMRIWSRCYLYHFHPIRSFETIFSLFLENNDNASLTLNYFLSQPSRQTSTNEHHSFQGSHAVRSRLRMRVSKSDSAHHILSDLTLGSRVPKEIDLAGLASPSTQAGTQRNASRTHGNFRFYRANDQRG
jgi:hypothetical protein